MMGEVKNICVVTGTRAEYGLLQNLMRHIQESDQTVLQLIATGTHLVREFGFTLDQIEADGFIADKKVDMLLASDSAVSVSKSMALAQIGFSEAFEDLAPDLLVILGDRYEMLSAASSALIAGIPIAHIHGGEVTEGAMDESIRHAITKMSHLHFASTLEYKNRIEQMGENPDHVFHVGAPGLDHLDVLTLLSVDELSDSLQYALNKPFGVITYHPVTIPNRPNIDALNELLAAIDHYSDRQFIITYPNADTFGRQLIDRLKEFSAPRENIFLTASLGKLRYLSALKHCEFVLGNSSSGIIEAPSLGRPTINIGDRQKGRIFASNVIHCREEREEIMQALQLAMSPEVQSKVRTTINPYKKGNASDQIFERLLAIDFKKIHRKPFYDIVTKIK